MSKWDGLVSVGGDGLLVEVVQGLMDRDDWEKALQLPVAPLPGGSGNGLVKTLTERANVPYGYENMAFLICRGAS